MMQFAKPNPRQAAPPPAPNPKPVTPPPPSPQMKALSLFNQALQATRAKKLPLAEKLYRQMLEIDPRASVGWINLALLLGRQRRFDEAIAATQKAIRLSPKEASFQAKLASLEWGAGRTNEAIVTARTALALSPTNTEALRTLAGALVSQKRFLEALVPLKAMTALAPKDPTLLGTLATTQLDAQQPTEALATLRSLTQRFPREVNAFLMRGDLAGQLGTKNKDTKLFAESRDAYQRAFALSPKNLRAGFNVAVATEQIGDQSGTIKQLEILRERFPEAALVRHSLALAYLRDSRRTAQDQVALGMKEAEAAVGREPKNPEYVATLGYMVLSQGSSREYGQRAAKIFESALKLDPQHTRSQRGLVEALLVQSAWEAAIPKLRALLVQKPEDDLLRRKLAATLQAAGKRVEAALELRTIAQRNPTETRTLKELAALLETENKPEEAEKTLEEALGRDPADQDTLLRLGGLRTRRGQYDRAQAHFEAVLTKTPDSAEAFAGLVALFAAQKKPTEVLTTHERWVKADPKSNQARYELGMLYAELGRDSDAQKMLQSLTLRQGDPSRSSYRQALAEFYRRKGRFADEVTEVRNLLVEEPTNESLKARLAEALERAGKLPEAEEAYKALIARSPANDLKYRLTLIGLHERMGKIDLAIQELEELISLRTGSEEARAALIRLRTAQKRPEAAAAFFEKVALSEAGQPNPYLTDALDELYQAMRTPEKFIEFLKKAAETYPKSGPTWRRLAYRLEFSKRYPEALICWQKLIDIDTTGSEAPFMAGKILEDQGKKSEAIIAYTLSVKRKRSTAGTAALQRLGAPVPK